MDNLTHSLAGIVTAEVIVAARTRAGGAIDPRWHRAAWLASVAAHNGPDLDFVYTRITEGRLGYLVHHRGHTHTLALAPLMAALAYLAVWLWARRAGPRWSRGDHAWMALVAGLGPLGHIALDAANNYGVHPFWPVWNGWLAGDAVFIVEPLFWACTIPLAVLATRARWGRRAWIAVLALTGALPWVASAYVAWPFALASTLLGAAVLASSARLGQAPRALLALGSSLGVLAVFVAHGRAAESRLRTALETAHPDHEILDVSGAPLPAAPPCWEMIALSRERGGDRYALRIARVSVHPEIVPIELCSRVPRERTTAPLARDVLRVPGIWIEAEHEGSIAGLRTLAGRCDGAAYFAWVRMPFVVPQGDELVLGDLRYDREAELSFAELRAPAGPPETCPRFVPPWEPWRQDLLRP